MSSKKLLIQCRSFNNGYFRGTLTSLSVNEFSQTDITLSNVQRLEAKGWINLPVDVHLEQVLEINDYDQLITHLN